MPAKHPTPGPRIWPVLAPIAVAAGAMVATLPGRTHGLGLITEALLQDLSLERVPFAALNFWATLLGAAFCPPVGWIIDRVGIRVVLGFVLMALGAVVLAMTTVSANGRSLELLAPDWFITGGFEWSAVPAELFLLVLLTRGLGQSALSVASLALAGKAAGRKPGLIIGLYSFLVATGFFAAFGAIKYAFEVWHLEWRSLWGGLGWILLAAGPLAWLVTRDPKPAEESAADSGGSEHSMTLGRALLTPGFWVFGLATSFYGLVASGMSLFNQSLLAERGFDRGVFLTITTLGPVVGLAANLAGGWLATRFRLGVVLAAAMLIQALALAVFPVVTSLAQVYAYAVAMGVSGGLLTVIFFTVWRQAYGPGHLGKIQGAAQLLTVLASAAGPLVLAAGQRAAGSYVPVLQSLAVISGVLVVAAWLVPLPNAGVEMKDEANR